MQRGRQFSASVRRISEHRMTFQFERTRIDKIPREAVLAELERVAEHLGFVEFGKRDFDKEARVGSSTVVRTFGGWPKAMAALRSTLRRRGVDLKARPKGYFSDRALFAEMERIWGGLGHRPSRFEWEEAKPAISYQTYRRYFGGWQEACLKFLEHRLTSGPEAPGSPAPAASQRNVSPRPTQSPTKRPSREVPAGLRLKVYERDRFRCVFCGRSPISDLHVELHVDHVVPFVRGGETVLGNLQTLCLECNLGKADRDDVRQPSV